ncbi:MAG: carboxypeptidase regulatory-like domain-containing protein, partial [Terriglobia bacterium]
MNFLRRAFVTVALIGGLGLVSWAQNVTLSGHVLDPTGGAVAGASVQLLQGNQQVAETSTDLEGDFRLTVPPGEYRIEMAAPNFARHSEAVAVRLGMAVLSVTLELAALQQALEVQEQPATVSLEPDQNLSATVLTAEDLLDLPEDPGELAAVLQELAGESPDGASEMIVDGFTGGRLPSRDQIQEVRINRNPFSSEFSRPGRGRVEIVTRAGTGELHGNLSFNFRDDALNARQALADSKPPYQQRSFRANLGGPILRNRLTGTVSLMRSEEEESDSLHAITPEGLLSSAVVRPQNRWEVEGRLQYKLAERHTLDFGGERSSRRRENQGVGEITLPERAFNSDSSEYSFRARETAVLSSSTINEIRFQFDRETSRSFPLTSALAVNVLDAFQAGGAQNRSREFEREYQISNTTTFSRGPATFRAG